MARMGRGWPDGVADKLRGSTILLTTLGLSVRVERMLARDGLDTVGDVVAKSPRQIGYIRNFGDGSMRELTSALVLLATAEENPVELNYEFLYHQRAQQLHEAGRRIATLRDQLTSLNQKIESMNAEIAEAQRIKRIMFKLENENRDLRRVLDLKPRNSRMTKPPASWEPDGMVHELFRAFRMNSGIRVFYRYKDED